MWKRVLHWFSHLTKTNTGNVISWNENGMICVGFECSVCKKVDEKSVVRITEKEMLDVRYPNSGSLHG